MFSCKQATEAAARQLEEPLTRITWIRLRIHVFICSGCRLYQRQIEGIHRLLKAYWHQEMAGPSQPNETLSAEAKARMEAALHRKIAENAE